MKKITFFLAAFLLLSFQTWAQFNVRYQNEGNLDITMVSSMVLQPVWLTTNSTDTDPIPVKAITTEEQLASGRTLSQNNYMAGVRGIPGSRSDYSASLALPAESVNGTDVYTGMVYADCDDDNTTFQSSAAFLDLGAADAFVIEKAFLYWSAASGTVVNYNAAPYNLPTMKSFTGNKTGIGDGSNMETDNVLFKPAGETGYQSVTGTRVNATGVDNNTFVADVTNLVQGHSGGMYWVANVRSGLPVYENFNVQTGWSLVVIYSQPASQPRIISLVDGDVKVDNGATTIVNLTLPYPTLADNAVSYLGYMGLDAETFAASGPLADRCRNCEGGNAAAVLAGNNPIIVKADNGEETRVAQFIDQAPLSISSSNGRTCNAVYDASGSSTISTFSKQTGLNGNAVDRIPDVRYTCGYDAHHVRLPQGAVPAGAQGVAFTLPADGTGSWSARMAYLSIGLTDAQFYDITSSAGENGIIVPLGVKSVESGNGQLFNFKANPGYVIYEVLINGVNNPEAVAAGSYTFSNVDADNNTIEVNFKKAGCTDPTALNYDPSAEVDDGSCRQKTGCMDPGALNYDSSAVVDDGSCKQCMTEDFSTVVVVGTSSSDCPVKGAVTNHLRGYTSGNSGYCGNSFTLDLPSGEWQTAGVGAITSPLSPSGNIAIGIGSASHCHLSLPKLSNVKRIKFYARAWNLMNVASGTSGDNRNPTGFMIEVNGEVQTVAHGTVFVNNKPLAAGLMLPSFNPGFDNVIRTANDSWTEIEIRLDTTEPVNVRLLAGDTRSTSRYMFSDFFFSDSDAADIVLESFKIKWTDADNIQHAASTDEAGTISFGSLSADPANLTEDGYCMETYFSLRENHQDCARAVDYRDYELHLDGVLLDLTEDLFGEICVYGCYNVQGGTHLLEIVSPSSAPVQSSKGIQRAAYAGSGTVVAAYNIAINGVSTGVAQPEKLKAKPVAYYNTLFQQLPTEPAKGVYLILYDNGRVEKKIK
jgi:hypothetical protein